MAVPFKRLGRHDCLVFDRRDDPASPDPATVEHMKGLSDRTTVKLSHERVNAEHVKTVVGESAVADGLDQMRP
jgi:hypothetical protein